MQIAIIGRDGSGKSTLADYLGQCLAKAGIVVVIDTDLTQPTLPVRLPGHPLRKEQSLGRAVAGTGTTEIRPYLIQHPCQEGLFFSGLVYGDDYMEYELGLDSSSVAGLFARNCREQLDHVILDCSGQRTDPFIPDGLTESDRIILMLTPDLQGVCWWRSMQTLLSEMAVLHKIIAVVSQMHRHHQNNWIEEGIGQKADCFLPFAAELNQLRSAGKTIDKPLTKSGRQWYQAMERLLEDILNTRGDSGE